MYAGKLGTGIYTITNQVDGKMYVGLAMDIHDRLNGHRWKLIHNQHDNSHLQRAFNKYGIDNFLFEALEECDENHLAAMEHYWCNILNTTNRKYGYNLRQTSPYSKQGRMSLESREKMRIAQKGKPKSEKEKERRKEAARKRYELLSEEDKEKFNKRLRKNIKGDHNHVAVVRLNIEGNYVDEYKSVKSLREGLNIPYTSLNYCLMGIMRSWKGWIFVKKKDYDPTKDYNDRVRKRIVIKYDNQGTVIKEYPSITAATDENKLPKGAIQAHCRRKPEKGYTKYGFTYKLKSNAVTKKAR